MKEQRERRTPARTVAVLAMPLYLVVFWIALWAPRWTGYPRNVFVLPSAVTHGLMVLGSIILIVTLGRGEWRRFGFTRGSYRFRPAILLWVLPTAAFAILGSLSGGARNSTRSPLSGSPLQTILFVWIVASISEEIFARGLFQGLLSDWSTRGVRLFRRWFLGLPVWISAVTFGLGHLVLLPIMGSMTIPICISATLLGLLAGYHRQVSGSLIPAILVHALFNIGGTLPAWLISR